MRRGWVQSSWVGLMIYLTKNYMELMLVCVQPAVVAAGKVIRESFVGGAILVTALGWYALKNAAKALAWTYVVLAI